MICRVENVPQLVALWKDVEDCIEKGEDLKALLGRLLCCIHGGILLVVLSEARVCGFCAASVNDDMTATLQCLPRGPSSHDCIRIVKDWAKVNGIKEVLLISNRLNGSNFRYVEDTLGFHRKAMLFSLPIT